MTTFDEMHENLRKRMQFMSDEELRREVLEQMFIFYYEENAIRKNGILREMENNKELKMIKEYMPMG